MIPHKKTSLFNTDTLTKYFMAAQAKLMPHLTMFDLCRILKLYLLEHEKESFVDIENLKEVKLKTELGFLVFRIGCSVLSVSYELNEHNAAKNSDIRLIRHNDFIQSFGQFVKKEHGLLPYFCRTEKELSDLFKQYLIQRIEKATNLINENKEIKKLSFDRLFNIDIEDVQADFELYCGCNGDVTGKALESFFLQNPQLKECLTEIEKQAEIEVKQKINELLLNIKAQL